MVISFAEDRNPTGVDEPTKGIQRRRRMFFELLKEDTGE